MSAIFVPKDSLFSCKISLKECRTPVWRRVFVPTDYTFKDLHKVIQAVMEWNDTHLHLFRFRHPDSGQKFEIKGPGVRDFGERFDDICFIPESSEIATFVKRLKQKIYYEYDFGLSWDHVEFEKIVDASCGAQYPQCIKGKEMPPPEDNPDDTRSEVFDLKRIDANLRSHCRQFAKELNSKVVRSVSKRGSTMPENESSDKESNEPPAKKRLGQSSTSSSK